MEQAVGQIYYFPNLREAMESLLKYLLVNKILLTDDKHFLVCYLVIRRGFVGVYKAISRAYVRVEVD